MKLTLSAFYKEVTGQVHGANFQYMQDRIKTWGVTLPAKIESRVRVVDYECVGPAQVIYRQQMQTKEARRLAKLPKPKLKEGNGTAAPKFSVPTYNEYAGIQEAVELNTASISHIAKTLQVQGQCLARIEEQINRIHALWKG